MASPRRGSQQHDSPKQPARAAKRRPSGVADEVLAPRTGSPEEKATGNGKEILRGRRENPPRPRKLSPLQVRNVEAEPSSPTCDVKKRSGASFREAKYQGNPSTSEAQSSAAATSRQSRLATGDENATQRGRGGRTGSQCNQRKGSALEVPSAGPSEATGPGRSGRRGSDDDRRLGAAAPLSGRSPSRSLSATPRGVPRSQTEPCETGRGPSRSPAPSRSPSASPSPRVLPSSRSASFEPGRGQEEGRRGSAVASRASSPTQRLDEKLPFVDLSLNEVSAAISDEDPDFQFDANLWCVLLSGQPSAALRPIQHKDLSYWVDIFARWQEMQRQELCDESVDGDVLSKLSALPKSALGGIIELFDPEGHKRLRLEGLTAANLSRTHMPMLELLAAGVMLSSIIMRELKLKFLLGLFDVDDRQAMDEEQFSTLLANLVVGLAKACHVPRILHYIPSKALIHRVAGRLFNRIGRLKKKDNAKEIEASRGCVSLSFDVILDWCCGNLSNEDVFALPYKLVIERFCRAHVGDLADQFDETFKNFNLSHTSATVVPMPPECPKHGKSVFKCQHLTRSEVLAARAVFHHAQDLRTTRLLEAEVDEIIQNENLSATENFQRRLSQALDGICSKMRPGVSVSDLNLSHFLSVLSPCAQPKHLRMYDAWCHEYDTRSEQKLGLQTIEDAAKSFQATKSKPVLPPEELIHLEQEFDRLDEDGDGLLAREELMHGWTWGQEIAGETMSAFGTRGTEQEQKMNKDGFIRMMCPMEYRLPQMDGVEFDSLGKLLLHETACETARQNSKHANLCANSKPSDTVTPMPPSAFPIVPESLLNSWVELFERLDTNSDCRVCVKELEESGYLWLSACKVLVQLIEPESNDSFSRECFLNAICKAHGYRRRLE